MKICPDYPGESNEMTRCLHEGGKEVKGGSRRYDDGSKRLE